MIIVPRFNSIVLIGFTGLLVGCATQRPAPADWRAWQQKRLESIGGTNGWTTLAGLHWLREGNNSAGSNPTNDAVLPAGRVPGAIGTFIRRGTNVSFIAASGANARVAGLPVENIQLVTDADNTPTKLEIGALTIIAIQRSERMGLRVRDPNSPDRQHFKGLHWFPYDPAWRLEGIFVPFSKPKTMRVQDVTGGSQEYVSPGTIVFKFNGMDYRLDVADEPGETDFFVMFQDLTSGKDTYGAGRFMYVSPPKVSGRVLIDFNHAYTPPCGFTPYATCPLPPHARHITRLVPGLAPVPLHVSQVS